MAELVKVSSVPGKTWDFKYLIGISLFFAGPWLSRLAFSIEVKSSGTETEYSELKVHDKHEKVKPSCQSGKTIIYE